MTSRKADISINTIIVAALGLLVLVVLIAVFTGRFAIFTQDVGTFQGAYSKCTNACAALGGSGAEITTGSCTSPKNQMPGDFGKNSANTQQICCCAPSSPSDSSSTGKKVFWVYFRSQPFYTFFLVNNPMKRGVLDLTAKNVAIIILFIIAFIALLMLNQKLLSSSLKLPWTKKRCRNTLSTQSLRCW